MVINRSHTSGNAPPLAKWEMRSTAAGVQRKIIKESALHEVMMLMIVSTVDESGMTVVICCASCDKTDDRSASPVGPGHP